ncbi:hypothetical protein PND93_02675 [Faecalicoccus pleomorphus]|uniref:hypothetical protein n=1 Tax=Faecalicoccus pleomorphus TaxID=1323 RepID=UPI00232BF1A5|nr:hypothetical protein [Faecalicoccus pleomorphus]MDB7990489.1 hypothetical protein [Faecalicoccus pleomorphus]
MAVTNKDICKTCEDLQQHSPDFVANGVTDEMCSNLESNTGLMNNGRENCTDLHNANDCLIGGIAEKATSYNPCDPNKMIEDLAKNTMHVIDMLICSDCGQWNEIKKIWDEIQKIWDAIEELQNGMSDQNANMNKMLSAVEKILQNLKNSGAWTVPESGSIWDGSMTADRNIATGNINVFGGTPDGSTFIRTNNTSTENDLAGGI